VTAPDLTDLGGGRPQRPPDLRRRRGDDRPVEHLHEVAAADNQQGDVAVPRLGELVADIVSGGVAERHDPDGLVPHRADVGDQVQDGLGLPGARRPSTTETVLVSAQRSTPATAGAAVVEALTRIWSGTCVNHCALLLS